MCFEERFAGRVLVLGEWANNAGPRPVREDGAAFAARATVHLAMTLLRVRVPTWLDGSTVPLQQ